MSIDLTDHTRLPSSIDAAIALHLSKDLSELRGMLADCTDSATMNIAGYEIHRQKLASGGYTLQVTDEHGVMQFHHANVPEKQSECERIQANDVPTSVRDSRVMALRHVFIGIRHAHPTSSRHWWRNPSSWFDIPLSFSARYKNFADAVVGLLSLFHVADLDLTHGIAVCHRVDGAGMVEERIYIVESNEGGYFIRDQIGGPPDLGIFSWNESTAVLKEPRRRWYASRATKFRRIVMMQGGIM